MTPERDAVTRAREVEMDARDGLMNILVRYAEMEHPNRDHPALTWKYEVDVEGNTDIVFAYRDAVRAALLAEVVAVVAKLDGFELDRGRGYGCHCEMKREKTTEFYAADWLDRDDTLTAIRALTEAR